MLISILLCLYNIPEMMKMIITLFSFRFISSQNIKVGTVEIIKLIILLFSLNFTLICNTKIAIRSVGLALVLK
jgi:hypothetical protein